jgi:aminoglycoside phosphotransferase (APT) family kinase protein
MSIRVDAMDWEIANTRDGINLRLTQLMRRILCEDCEVKTLHQLAGGSSQETWAFEVNGAADRKLILRRGIGGVQHARPHVAGLANEPAVITRAHTAGVPTPAVLYVLTPEDGLGQGYIMDCLEGETIARKILRDRQFDAIRPLLSSRCGEALARIHSLDGYGLGLRQSDAAGELDQYYRKYSEQTEPHPVFELAFYWLRQHLPAACVPALVHGDFRLGNLIIGPDKLNGVLDWELAHIGDPMEDIAFMCVPSWRYGNLDLPVGGFGRREDFYSAYETAGGQLDIKRARWWELFGILKWGVICGGMALTFRNGTDRSPERGIIGRRASEAEIDLLRELSVL